MGPVPRCNRQRELTRKSGILFIVSAQVLWVRVCLILTCASKVEVFFKIVQSGQRNGIAVEIIEPVHAP
jgi:hypothetical protein